ncbi:neprilysin-4-like [Paramacrobiotus metropolitanus]|uniref:neprilysin-4-like n=1 Tax=Paramacrobiotus metropolitanus TaxID=2943436 RepID=UPI00244584AE|nr:neprilysin-4-like [Paramacrobiotus metropolitanus]XP_055345831.1 neprilysin-4-like [Paramacrobiotus metropolitanus]
MMWSSYGSFSLFFPFLLAASIGDLPITIHPPTDADGGSRLPTPLHEAEDNICRTEACVTRAALMLQSMNTSVEPCQDFFEYACGNWNVLNPIPPDYAKWGVLQQMQQQLFAKLRNLMDFNGTDVSTARKKARQVYAACSDINAIEESGSLPFIDALNNVMGSWPMLNKSWDSSQFSVLDTYSKMAREGQSYLISMYVSANQENPREHILFFDETSLGLPSKKMYYRSSSERTRRGYMALMKNLTKLLAEDLKVKPPNDLDKQLKDFFDFEAAIANFSFTEEERRDPYKTFHKMTLNDFLDHHFNKTFNKSDILQALRNIPLNGSVAEAIQLNLTVNVVNPSYYEKLDDLLSKKLSDKAGTGKRFIASYWGWRLLQNAAAQLSKRYRDAAFEFDKVYSGVKEESPRWRTCVDYTNSAMKLAVGSIYVDIYFGMEAKSKLLGLVSDIQNSFERILNEIRWMDSETKDRALKKLRAVMEYIGYPDFILQDLPRLDLFYEKFNISNSHFVNDKNIDVQITAKHHEDLLKPSLRNIDENVAPATVNAYYYPQKNIIAFLAGIMQPPVFHKDYPDYLNYAALGQVFGHELTHGFDDKGSLFDEEGRLSAWWTNTSRINYLNRAKTVIEQYNSYNTSAGNLNGVLTSGENIADNGGVKEAYMAFKQYLSRVNESSISLLPGLESFSVERVYFLASAQTWCGYYRPEYMANNILLSVHSPYPFRVMGPLSNLPDFAEAFNCPSGSPMNPSKRAGVW